MRVHDTVIEKGTRLEVRNGVVEPAATSHDEGVMFTVWRNGGIGYGATSDLTDAGLTAAAERASQWAAATLWTKRCERDTAAAHGRRLRDTSGRVVRGDGPG